MSGILTRRQELVINESFLFLGHQRRRRRRLPSDFTYISGPIKYTMFIFNFLFWLLGGMTFLVQCCKCKHSFETYKFYKLFFKTYSFENRNSKLKQNRTLPFKWKNFSTILVIIFYLFKS